MALVQALEQLMSETQAKRGFHVEFRGLHQGTVMKFMIFDTGNSVDQIGLFHM